MNCMNLPDRSPEPAAAPPGPPTHHHHKRRPHPADADFVRRELGESNLPTGPTAEAYRIAGYSDGLVGAKRPECDLLRPRYNSGLKWPDKNNPLPDDPLWGGVRAGVTWDGTFFRDLTRYAGSGALFWSAYLKPGSAPGIQNGYWLNFGGGWCHLANDDLAQMLTGATPRILYQASSGVWLVIIEATLFVTGQVALVWSGGKPGGNDPVGPYTRIAGCDPLPGLTLEAV